MISEEAIEEAPEGTGQMQGRVSDGKADAILVSVRHRLVIEIGLGEGDVAPRIMAGHVGKPALQNERDFRALMCMGGHAAPGPNPQQTRVAASIVRDPEFFHTRQFGTPADRLEIVAEIMTQGSRKQRRADARQVPLRSHRFSQENRRQTLIPARQGLGPATVQFGGGKGFQRRHKIAIVGLQKEMRCDQRMQTRIEGACTIGSQQRVHRPGGPL